MDSEAQIIPQKDDYDRFDYNNKGFQKNYFDNDVLKAEIDKDKDNKMLQDFDINEVFATRKKIYESIDQLLKLDRYKKLDVKTSIKDSFSEEMCDILLKADQNTNQNTDRKSSFFIDFFYEHLVNFCRFLKKNSLIAKEKGFVKESEQLLKEANLIHNKLKEYSQRQNAVASQEVKEIKAEVDQAKKELKSLKQQIKAKKDIINSIAITNTLIRKDPNDKAMHKFFTPSSIQAEKQKMPLRIGIVKKGKNKGKDVAINVDWHFTPEFLALNPQIEEFDAWDKVVIKTCISEYVTHTLGDFSKPFDTTLESLYRAMVGDDGTTDRRKSLTPKIKQEMLRSIDKARMCNITIDLTFVCEQYGYNNGKPAIYKGNILSCSYIDGVIVNGKPTTVLHFTDISPLYKSAEIQNNQILTYDKKILALPTKNKNKDSIIIGDYYWCRVLEIKNHKMTPTIKFETAFERLGYINISKDKRKQILEHVEAYFEYWLEIGEIKSYFFVDKKGQKIKGAMWRTVERKTTDGTTHKVSEIYRPKARRTTLGFYAVTFTY